MVHVGAANATLANRAANGADAVEEQPWLPCKGGISMQDASDRHLRTGYAGPHGVLPLALATMLTMSANVLRAAPILELDPPVYHFGVRQETDTVRKQFSLRNAGDEALEISKVQSSCGCTVATLDEKTIAPGDTVALQVTFALRDRSGKQRKTIILTTNDPSNPTATLALEGMVEGRPQFDPKAVVFGRIDGKKVSQMAVSVQGPMKPAKDTPIHVDTQSFAAEWETSSDSELELRVFTRPPMAPGTHRGNVTVSIDSRGGHELSLPVFAYVAAPVRVLPRAILLPSEGRLPVEAAIMLISNTEGPFAVEAVRCPNGITATATETGNRQWRIDIRGIEDPDWLNGKEIIIETSSEERPTIRIPFRLSNSRD